MASFSPQDLAVQTGKRGMEGEKRWVYTSHHARVKPEADARLWFKLICFNLRQGRLGEHATAPRTVDGTEHHHPLPLAPKNHARLHRGPIQAAWFAEPRGRSGNPALIEMAMQSLAHKNLFVFYPQHLRSRARLSGHAGLPLGD